MKRNYFLLISMFLLSANCVWGQYSGGNGESSTPYLISNLTDLQTLASTVNNGTTYAGKYFELTAGIKVNSDETNLAGNVTTLLPIGTEKAPFAGNFDGKQHVVSNIKVVYNNSTMGDGGLGLFGKMSGGTLKNTGVKNIRIEAGTGQNAGGLIGRFDGTEMSNCFAEDVTITGGNATYGGLIGKVWSPTISNCYVKNVSLDAGYGNSRGGFIANLTNGGATITNCYAMDFTFGEASSDVIGLFCGKGDGGTINNCYAVQSDGKNYNFTHTTAGTTYKAGNTSVATGNDLIKTKADFSDVAFAWNLSTTNNSTNNSGIWSHNGNYPIFADADHAAIYKTGYTYQQDTRSAQTYNTTVADGFTAIDLRADADANIPSDVLNNILAKGSANCLVYAANAITGKENNVIVSGSGKLELTDAASFYCPESFTATSATYTRNFVAGWNTFCLPFPIEKGNDDIEELVNGTDTYVQFDVPTDGTLPANTPYLINIAASGNKTFSVVSSVTIPASATMNDKTAGNYIFKACISPTTVTSGYGLVLDEATGKEMFKKIPASGMEVPSFRAYLDAIAPSNASLKILHKGETTEIASINAENTFKVFGSDNAIHVITDKAQNISLFSIDGRLVKTVELSEGYNTIDGLLKGIYLINKQKVAVK